MHELRLPVRRDYSDGSRGIERLLQSLRNELRMQGRQVC